MLRAIARAAYVALTAALAVAVTPPAAHASGNFAIFTDRAAFLAAVQSRDGAPASSVDIANATSASDISGLIGTSSSASCASFALDGSAGAHTLSLQNGCRSSFSFSFQPTGMFSAFGIELTPVLLASPLSLSGVVKFNGVIHSFPPPFSATETGPIALLPGADSTVYLGAVLYGQDAPVDATGITDITFTLDNGGDVAVNHLDYSSAPVALAAVPEPATVALMATGLVAIGALARRRRRD